MINQAYESLLEEVCNDEIFMEQIKMKDKFFQLLRNKQSVSMITLGPRETSSFKSTEYLIDYLKRNGVKTNIVIDAYDDFDSAYISYKENNSEFLVVPNAYEKITNMYWDPELEVAFSYFYSTPIYGLAIQKGTDLNFTSNIIVATCNPVFSLINVLGSKLLKGKKVSVLTTKSTTEAAQMVHLNKADIAITNQTSLIKYGLEFLTTGFGVKMLWTVFQKKKK